MRRLNRQIGRGVQRLSWLHGCLRASTTATTLLLWIQAAIAAVPAPHVSTADVLAAMTKRKLPVENVRVVFPAGIAAKVEAPVLVVEQVTMRDAQSANLRLSCVTHGECPSFYVVVRWPQAPGNLAEALKDMPHTTAGAPMQTLRAGAHATLLIDQEKVHIRVPVVCAQGGAVGDRIRVMTPNRRQSYEAVVLTDTEVQGSL